MINIIPLIAALGCLIFASYHDIKTHSIPNWLPYFMVALGLGIHIGMGIWGCA